MIVKILGIIDIILAVLFWLFGMFHIIPASIILILAFYLLIKGLLFVISLDAASILDVIASILIFLSLNFTLPKIVIFIISFYLIQKGVFSLL